MGIGKNLDEEQREEYRQKERDRMRAKRTSFAFRNLEAKKAAERRQASIATDPLHYVKRRAEMKSWYAKQINSDGVKKKLRAKYSTDATYADKCKRYQRSFSQTEEGKLKKRQQDKNYRPIKNEKRRLNSEFVAFMARIEAEAVE